MKTRSLFIGSLSAIVVVVFVSACSDSPVEAATHSDITASLTVSNASFQASTGTVVRIRITNNGDSAVIVPPTECQTPFEVIRGTTTVVEANNGPCIGILPWRALLPGQSVTDERTWHGDDWNWATQLNSGQYALRARVFTGTETVVSAPVAVKILPR